MWHKRRREALEHRPTLRAGATLQHLPHFTHLRNRHSLKHERKHSAELQTHKVPAPQLAHAPSTLPAAAATDGTWSSGWQFALGGKKTQQILTSVPSPKQNTLPHSSKVHNLHGFFDFSISICCLCCDSSY